MFLLLFIVGLIFMAAGVFIIAFAIPIRETTLGSALLVVGSIAMTGGLIAVGLAATVSELQRLIGTLKARPPAVPRPIRPVERKEGDKRPGMPRMQFPPRPGGGEPAKTPPVPNPLQPALAGHPLTAAGPTSRGPEFPPPKSSQTDGSTQSSALPKPGSDWMRRAIAEIEAAPKPSPAGLTESVALANGSSEGRPRHPAVLQGISEMSGRIATPAAEAPEPRNGALASSPSIFDQVWPAQRRKPVDETAERGIEAAPNPLLRPLDIRVPEARSAPAPPIAAILSPAASVTAPPVASAASLAPGRTDPRPLSILKSGVIEEMAYTLFSDGSIEAQMPDGTMRFASVDALRQHLETSEN